MYIAKCNNNTDCHSKDRTTFNRPKVAYAPTMNWLIQVMFTSTVALFASLCSAQHSIVKRADPSVIAKTNICANISTGNELRIRAVLPFPGAIYLLSEQWQVYLANESLVNNTHKFAINLTEVTPVDIERQWPAFANHSRFGEIKSSANVWIYSVIINHTDYWVVINVPQQTGLKYNLHKDSLLDGWNDPTDLSIIRAPISAEANLYTLDYHPNGTVNLTFWDYRWHSEGGFSFVENRSLPMYYSKNESKLTINSTHSGDFVPLYGSEWPVLNGLLVENSFILFSPKHIFSFSATVVTGLKVEVSFIELSAIFACPEWTSSPMSGNSTTVSSNTTGESSSSSIMIIILCVVLALVILTTVGVITYLTSRKAKRRLQHHRHKNAKQARPNKQQQQQADQNKSSDIKDQRSKQLDSSNSKDAQQSKNK